MSSDGYDCCSMKCQKPWLRDKRGIWVLQRGQNVNSGKKDDTITTEHYNVKDLAILFMLW